MPQKNPIEIKHHDHRVANKIGNLRLWRISEKYDGFPIAGSIPKIGKC